MFERSQTEIRSTWQNPHGPPVVSITSVTYNHEKFIVEAMESFLAQRTAFAFEILIGEDCSTDNTGNILAEYQKQYPDIVRVVSGKKNVGVKQNSHRLLQAVRGEYFTMCDGDDYWTNSHKVQAQVDALQAQKKCNICLHSIYQKLGNSLVLAGRHNTGDTHFSAENAIRESLGFFTCNSIMLKTDIARSVQDLLLTAPHGDTLLGLSASVPGGAYYIDTPMSVYRLNVEDSWTKRHFSNLEGKLNWLSGIFSMFTELHQSWHGDYTNAIFDAKEKACNYVLMPMVSSRMQSLAAFAGNLDRYVDKYLKPEDDVEEYLLTKLLSILHQFGTDLSDKRQYALYGFGTVAQLILPYISQSVLCIVDRALVTEGIAEIQGIPVIAPAELIEQRNMEVIITPLYQRDVIQRQFVGKRLSFKFPAVPLIELFKTVIEATQKDQRKESASNRITRIVDL
ncbi:MAG: glycosyltransferase [Deltaproteobacteria bacterium]|nr:glycosyltransferase [Deltaproteobacteria bacterium]